MDIQEPTREYQARILIAEDDSKAAQALKQILEQDLGAQVDVVEEGKSALELLTSKFYSLFLTDLRMPYLDGMQLIREINERNLPVSVVVMTAHGSIEGVVEAMKAGAQDYLTKPLDLDHLKLIIQRTLDARALRDELVYLREQMKYREAFQEVITRNPKMLSILELITSLAHTTSTVLIEGETGTGKELITRAIHRASSQFRKGPLVSVNCAALPKELIESELFGHEKGSFTGATSQKIGKFEQANLGTMFLDEIGEIPLEMQVKLLRVLQERTFERIGGTQPIEINIRVVAATNRALVDEVESGKFREDLYYRVNVIRIEVPPLRERTEDIPLLAKHFCQKYVFGEEPKEVGPKAMQTLMDHDWPGNIRELENVIERSCITTQEPLIEEIQLQTPQAKSARRSRKIDLSRKLPDQLRELTASFEKRYIRKALRRTRGNVGRCAKICGVSRRTITAKIAEYDINKSEMKEP